MRSGDTTALVRAGDPALQEEVVGHGFIQPGKGLAGKGTRKKIWTFHNSVEVSSLSGFQDLTEKDPNHPYLTF